MKSYNDIPQFKATFGKYSKVDLPIIPIPVEEEPTPEPEPEVIPTDFAVTDTVIFNYSGQDTWGGMLYYESIPTFGDYYNVSSEENTPFTMTLTIPNDNIGPVELEGYLHKETSISGNDYLEIYLDTEGTDACYDCMTGSSAYGNGSIAATFTMTDGETTNNVTITLSTMQFVRD